MLQYMVGPAAEQAVNSCLPERRSQSENCPISKPSITCLATPTDTSAAASYAGVELDAPGVVSGEKSTDDPAEPDVLQPPMSSENHDVMLPTVAADQFPVVEATVVPKKRGRKPKRRRRVAATLAANCPPTSTQDSSTNTATSPRATSTLHSSQPSLDNCNSLQENIASKAPDEHRPAPKKRGRKPKQRPEVAVDSDVTKAGMSLLAKSPRRSSGPTGAPVMSELATATLTASAGNDSSATLSTSGGRGNAGVNCVMTNSRSAGATPRRRGRKRKELTSDKDDKPQEKLHVDEDRVQSVWKVTSPASPEYSGDVVPRIKVTNVRLPSRSTMTGSGESRGAGDTDGGTVATTSNSQTMGTDSGRQAALRVKSWRPMARRRDVSNTRTMVPVLERAHEWIHATPKPSRDDWTGPVFPAMEVVCLESENGLKDRPPAADALVNSPAKSGSRDDVDPHAGRHRQHLSAADGAVGGLVVRPDDVDKTGVIRGPRPQAAAVAVEAMSKLMYVVGGREGHGLPTARPQSREHGLPVNSVCGRSVVTERSAVASRYSTSDRQLLSSAVCSFANDSHAGQYMTKRVCLYSHDFTRLLLFYKFFFNNFINEPVKFVSQPNHIRDQKDTQKIKRCF